MLKNHFSKRLKLVLVLAICMVYNSYSQELILPDSIINFYKTKTIAYEYPYNKDNYQTAIQLYYNILNFPNANSNMKASVFFNIADLYAEFHQYDSAVFYYDKAFYSKNMFPEIFELPYRKKYFTLDTMLYISKIKEYRENFGKLYNYQELMIMKQLKSLLEVDQLARKFDDNYPYSCRKSILMFTDSLNMIALVNIINENPNIPNPFIYDGWSSFIIGRHIFTAYPEFWLTYIEPIHRQSLINGCFDIENYVRTYDRCVIFARNEYSYYGEYDDNGRMANPDTALVNQRRKNVGLPPLDQKETKTNRIYMTY